MIELVLVAELTLSNMLGPLVPIVTNVVVVTWSVSIIATLVAILKSPIIITRIVLSIPIVVVPIW